MPELNGLAKVLIGFGITLVVLGVLLAAVGKVPGFGRLPGDIYIQRPGFTLYIPITTMILVSLILSLVTWIFRR